MATSPDGERRQQAARADELALLSADASSS
jgi:hypothetical protein